MSASGGDYMTGGFGGYTCFACHQWIPPGIFHHCKAAAVAPWQTAYVTTAPVLNEVSAAILKKELSRLRASASEQRRWVELSEERLASDIAKEERILDSVRQLISTLTAAGFDTTEEEGASDG